ncbi:hypothetical protein ACH5RR_019836 [Cinchona calisaya]|uniref:Uncharacterized protein n=1 Tax=Cinchona calisaya TaxID=153742 RepID=A0ABD2ZU33_9GENT
MILNVYFKLDFKLNLQVVSYSLGSAMGRGLTLSEDAWSMFNLAFFSRHSSVVIANSVSNSGAYNCAGAFDGCCLLPVAFGLD